MIGLGSDKKWIFLLQLARSLCQGCPECQQSWAIFAFCWQAKVILSTFQKKRKIIILIFWKELYVIQLESWEEEVISTYSDQFWNELCQWQVEIHNKIVTIRGIDSIFPLFVWTLLLYVACWRVLQAKQRDTETWEKRWGL